MKSFKDNPALRFLTPTSPVPESAVPAEEEKNVVQELAQAPVPVQAQRDYFTKRLPVMLDVSMYKDICNEAARQRVSLAELVRRALAEYLRGRCDV